MPEVFSAIVIASWPHDQKAVSEAKASSVCLNLKNNPIKLDLNSVKNSSLYYFLRRHVFALPEINLEKGCDRAGIVA